jgi:hypothetical protein
LAGFFSAGSTSFREQLVYFSGERIEGKKEYIWISEVGRRKLGHEIELD